MKNLSGPAEIAKGGAVPYSSVGKHGHNSGEQNVPLAAAGTW